MTSYERAVTAIAARLVPEGSTDRADLVNTAVDAGRNASWTSQLLELGSMAALGLRLRARVATDDNARQTVAQAALLAACLTLLGAAGWAWATVEIHTTWSVLAIVLFLAAVGVLNNTARFVLAVSGGLCWLLLVDTDPAAVVAGALVGAVASAVATHAPARTFRSPILILTVVAVAAEALVSFTSAGPISTSAIVALAALGPMVLLAWGWFDPRFAVAATVVWLWRLLATDSGELASGFHRLFTALTVDEIVIRCIIMASAVITGSLVSFHAVTRSSQI